MRVKSDTHYQGTILEPANCMSEPVEIRYELDYLQSASVLIERDMRGCHADAVERYSYDPKRKISSER
jgi:hypothetical protein